jgi:hypothetical protein
MVPPQNALANKIPSDAVRGISRRRAVKIVDALVMRGLDGVADVDE